MYTPAGALYVYDKMMRKGGEKEREREWGGGEIRASGA